MGRLDDAELVLRDVLDIPPDRRKHERLTECVEYLSAVLLEKGNLERAKAFLEEAVRFRMEYLGEDNANTLRSMNSLALVLRRMGKRDEAEVWNRKIVAIRTRCDGEDNPGTLWASHNGGSLLDPQSPPPEAGGRLLARDEFDGRLGLDWQILLPDPSHFSLTTNLGMLTITTQEGDPMVPTYQTFENLFLVDYPGVLEADFQITTCITAFSPVAEFQQAGLIIYTDHERMAFQYQAHGLCEFSIEVGYPGQPEPKEVNFTERRGLDKVWLRITKHGNRYTFSTSVDGHAFSPMRYPDWDDTGLFQGDVIFGDGSVRRVGLFAVNGQGDAAPEIDASFDFFEVRSLGPEGKTHDETPPADQEHSDDRTQ